MSKQCPNCRKISKGQVESCESCGFSFLGIPKSRRSFADMCWKIGVAITIAASVTAVIAKLI